MGCQSDGPRWLKSLWLQWTLGRHVTGRYERNVLEDLFALTIGIGRVQRSEFGPKTTHMPKK